LVAVIQRPEGIDERVIRLTEALKQTVGVIGEINKEIEARSRLAAGLQDDIQRYKELATVKRSAAEAVARTIRCEIRSESRRTFARDVALNFLFFVLGAVVSYLLPVILHLKNS
jgi:hypothetical protein